LSDSPHTGPSKTPRERIEPDPAEMRRASILGNRLHSLIIGVPVLVVLIAIGVYLQRSDSEAHSPLLLESSVHLTGSFQGSSGTERERYLWLIDADGRRRGLRLHARQERNLAELARGAALELDAAPRAEGDALWLVRLAHDGQTLIQPE